MIDELISDLEISIRSQNRAALGHARSRNSRELADLESLSRDARRESTDGSEEPEPLNQR